MLFYLKKENNPQCHWLDRFLSFRFLQPVLGITKRGGAKKFFSVVLLWVFVLFSFQSTVQAAFLDFLSEKNKTTVPPVERLKLISILVEDSLLRNNTLESKIQRYARDVQEKTDGKVVFIPIPRDASPLDIYEGNAALYFSGLENDGKSQLIGTILIGEVPLPIIEKNENLWPTIYPYTDFEKPSYFWDTQKNRFVYQGGGDEEPEIWHGLIRSDIGTGEGYDEDDLADIREDQYVAYFDANHAVHQGTESFGKKVFYMDLPRQKEGMNEEMKKRYENYILHLEDAIYLRFNKYWFADLLLDAQFNEAIPLGLLPENVAPSELPNMAGDAIKMPDVQTKYPIENLLKRYFEAWGQYLSQVNSMVGVADRWDPKDIDTTISLVSRKDEAAGLFLKSINDNIESSLNAQLVEKNISENISVPDTTDALFAETVLQPYGKPLFWNGVSRSSMDSEDCSLLRGSPRDTSYPYSQMVEANRTYDVRTAQSSFQSPLCEHSSASQDEKDADQYAGCCALNLKVDSNTFSYSYDTCNTGSQWIDLSKHRGAELPVFSYAGTTEKTEGNQGSKGCSSIIDTFDEDPDVAQRFDSLMIHNEPRPETLTAQVESMSTMSLPVDDPRGFSFYDHAKNFHRLDYFNVFNLRELYMDASEPERKILLKAYIQNQLQQKIQEINSLTQAGNTVSNARLSADTPLDWPGTKCQPPVGYGCYDDMGVPIDEDICREYTKSTTHPDSFTTRIDWDESCTWTKWGLVGIPPVPMLLDTITPQEKIVRFYETGAVISESLLEGVVNSYDLDRVVDNIIWIDKSLDEKNREVFEKAFGPLEEAQKFFFDDAFHGYEFVEILGEKAEADVISDNGFQMVFEQGVDPNEEAFLSTQRTANEFQQGEKTIQTFLGEDFEKTFLGKEQIESQCASDDFVSQIQCYAEQTKANAQKPIRSFFPEDGSAPIVNSPFLEKTSLDEVSALKITPSSIRISAQEVNPIAIEVVSLNKAGRPVFSDFDSEVNLKFSSSDAEKFFTIQPSVSQKVVAGKAKFYLFPKENNVGGKFSIFAQIKNIKSSEIPVQVSKFAFSGFAEDGEVVAGKKEGVRLKIQLRENGNIVSSYDGKQIQFSSQWGTFEKNNVTVLEKGAAEILFFPGERAGKADIVLQDQEKELPEYHVHLDIIPDIPDNLEFDVDSPYLVRTQQFSSLKVLLEDKFGNRIKDIPQTLSWSGEGLEIQGTQTSSLETQVSGAGILSIRPQSEAKIAKLQVWSDTLGKEKLSTQEFVILKNGILRTEISQDIISVEDDTPVNVLVWGEASDGKKITGTFDVGIINEPGGIGEAPSKFTLRDGLGEFQIRSGMRAGKATFRLASPGFSSSPFNITILPGTAQKILLSPDRKILNKDGREKLNLDMEVIDTYGNTVQDFSSDISFKINETKGITSEDIDQLKSLDVISSGGREQLYLEGQAGLGISSSPNTIITIKEGETVQLQNGKKRVTVSPRTSNGEVYLTTESEALTPAVTDFDVTQYFTISELRALTPQTLFTLMLGFEGGDMVRGQNVGNAYLFSGKSQAIGTLMTNPNPESRFGFLSATGEISSDIMGEFRFADMATVELFSGNKSLATAQLHFGTEPELQITSSVGKREGLYFVPEASLAQDFTQSGKTISYFNQPLLTLSSQGGIHFQVGDMTLTSENQSIFIWKVKKSETIVGTLYFVLDKTNISIVDDFENQGDESGIVVQKNAFDIQLQKGFTGFSTNNPQGIFFVNPEEKESVNKILGSSKKSAEDATTKELGIVWEDEWKPGTYFSAGNSIGLSTQWAASDAFILLGDPTLTVATENPKVNLNLTEDIGKQLWKSKDGPIDQILNGDINGDGYEDIFARVGNLLFALYQDDMENDNFRSTGPILRFGDGAKALVAFDNDRDEFSDLLQVNDAGKTIVHKNINGTYARENIDLGLEKGISEIQGAQLDGDMYRDLVVLDSDNCLWKILGIENGFGVPQKIYCFASSLGEITETYNVSENQKPEDEYIDPNKYKYLSEFLIDYGGLEDEIKSDGEEDYFCSETSPERSFVPLSRNNRINATVDFGQSSEEQTLLPGTSIDLRLTIESDSDLENLQIVIPHFAGLNLEKKSISCQGCSQDPVQEVPLCNGETLIRGGGISDHEKVLLEWKMTVGELPPIKYFVDDYFRGDTLDDILIPFKEDDMRKIAKFEAPPHILEILDISSLTIPTVDDFVSSASDTEVADELLAPLKTDSDGDGYPDMYESSATEGGVDAGLMMLVNTLNSTSCGGGCGLPIISKTFLAPGSETIYAPPLGFPGGFDPGFPVLAFPTTLYTPVGPIPFLWPGSPIGKQYIEGPFNSFFRMYVMPTTTGAVGLGICLGSYPVNMVPPVFIPTCFVVAPSILGALGVCSSNPNSGVGGMSFGKDENESSFIPKVKFEITNKSIESADIVTRWLDKQYEALSNIKMPIIDIKFPETSSQDETETALREGGDIFQKATHSPFVDIKRRKVTISYPSVTKDDVQGMKDEYKEWKNQYKVWREDAVSKIENYSENLEIKVAAEEYLKNADEMLLNIEKNISAVEGYDISVVSLKEIPAKIEKSVETIVQQSEITSDYFSNWMKSTEKAVERWGQFRLVFKSILRSWEAIPKIFQNFSISCPSCSVDRGTMHEWLLRILLSGVDFPVIQPPKLPNVNLDFSGLTFGNEIVIPEIVFEPVQLDIFSLPDMLPPFKFPPLSSISGLSNISLTVPNLSKYLALFPLLPKLPKLPVMPKLSLDFDLPTLSLPPLPTIPSPPKIPNILSPIEAIVQIPKAFLKLTCLLVMGIAPVPEWHVKAYVSQITNRSKLFGLDFSGAALTLPSLSTSSDGSSSGSSDITVKIENSFIATLESLQQVDKLAQISNETIAEISKATKIDTPTSAFFLPSENFSKTPHYTIRTQSIDLDKLSRHASLEREQEEFVKQSQEQIQFLLAQSKGGGLITTETKELVASAFGSLVPHFSSPLISSIASTRFGRWLVSTIDVGLVPTSLPEGFDVEKFETEQAQMQQDPAIYYFDGATETYEKVTQFPIPSRYAYWFADIQGQDGEREILYSLNDELYLKYRVVPTQSTEEQDARANRYEERYSEDYEDRQSVLYEWTWEKFKEQFAPVQSLNSETSIQGFSGEFKRIWDDISYFEWGISERPDVVFEIQSKLEDRKSKLWDRNAFLVRKKSKKYEIRPMTTRVKSITGSPILYASPPEEIPLLTQQDCENPSTEKPFYATESILVGLKDNSRMEIRVPPRPGQEEEFREIVLHAGEETMVEYAEVCLTRGAVERVSTEELEKMDPRRNLYLPEGARFELGPNDALEIQLFDGTLVKVLGNEKYSIHYFESEQMLVDFLKNIPLGNHYGWFQAFGRDGKSFFIPKFLHDPQLSDDTTPPNISIKGGTNIQTNVFQKVLVDATQTYDDQEIKSVWWDLYPEKDSDGDENYKNDKDFAPSMENVRSLLNVKLPAYELTGEFTVTLNVEDEAGNISSQDIVMTVSVPQISLYEASERDKSIVGKVKDGTSEVPLYGERMREGSGEGLVSNDPVLSGEEGNFQFSELNTSGGVEIKNKEESTVVEILSNGRPMVMDDRLGFVVQAATEEHPLRLLIHDERGETLAYVSFEQSDVNDVQILSSGSEIPQNNVWVRDIESQDGYTFRDLPYEAPFIHGGVALIDTQTAMTLGVLDARGDFYILDGADVSLQMKRAIEKIDPVVFELVTGGKVVGEFGMGVTESSVPLLELQ
ncbi:hypothetical protein K9L27_04020 [Candidatus Gracilibacteria bacterium]|nr:hypothetical protein [Candidatus Gracilibacteria bacterium]